MTKNEFLSKLADEARGSLSPEVTQALVCEVAGHLDESIQSRLELGEAPEVAEINAIAAFAQPASFVHKMEQVHDGARAHDPVLLATGAVVVLSLSFWMLFTGHSSFIYAVWLYASFGSIAALFLRSCFLRSPRWGTLKILTIASVVLIGGLQPLLTLNLWDYGGMGYVPATRVQAYVDARNDELVHPPSYGWKPSAGDVQEDIQAIREAEAAPLIERWQRSFGPSGGLMIFSIAVLVITHLTPIAFRRRLRRRRAGLA